jgi:hypothetical protein
MPAQARKKEISFQRPDSHGFFFGASDGRIRGKFFPDFERESNIGALFLPTAPILRASETGRTPGKRTTEENRFFE